MRLLGANRGTTILAEVESEERGGRRGFVPCGCACELEHGELEVKGAKRAWQPCPDIFFLSAFFKIPAHARRCLTHCQ